jgi:hypothetical protein
VSGNRSSEELAMREAVIEWGRRRWPGARVMHEVAAGWCRADLAFVGEDHLSAVEIKSSRDTLSRLEKQSDTFVKHFPEVWLAVAPKHVEGVSEKRHHDTGVLVVDDERVSEDIVYAPDRVWRTPARVNRSLTVPCLYLLIGSELLSICKRRGLPSRSRMRTTDLFILIARRLTGDEIVQEVCRELRARSNAWTADAPIAADAMGVLL